MSVRRCDVCKAPFLGAEPLQFNICKSCRKELVAELENDFENLYKFSKEDDGAATIEINCFLSKIFTREEIEDVLLRELKTKNWQYASKIWEYVSRNADYLIQKEYKEENTNEHKKSQ